MSYQLKGSIKVIGEVQTFPSGFSKRELVVTTDQDKYPQDIKLDFLKDRADMLDKVSVGAKVEVSFNISGREYNGKYFVNLEGWKLESLASVSEAKDAVAGSVAGAPSGGGAPAQEAPPGYDTSGDGNSADDDIPF